MSNQPFYASQVRRLLRHLPPFADGDDDTRHDAKINSLLQGESESWLWEFGWNTSLSVSLHLDLRQGTADVGYPSANRGPTNTLAHLALIRPVAEFAVMMQAFMAVNKFEQPVCNRETCQNCHGEGWVEATQWCPPNDGPCLECQGRGWRD